MTIIFPKDITIEEAQRLWPLWADVKCTSCGKELALSNTAPNQRCPRCGAICT